jgi:glycosyltransferase involved in cell wall biosynthesis
MLRPGGGPAGYLYNLKTALQPDQGPVGVDALASSDERKGASHDMAVVRWRRTKRLCGTVLPALAARRNRRSIFEALKIPPTALARWQRPDVLIVHELPLLAAYLPHRRRGQRLLYWPHCPTDWSTEFMSAPPPGLQAWGPRMQQHLLPLLQEEEIRLVERCDGVLASAPSALEYYFADRPQFRRRLLRHLTDHVLPGVPALSYAGPRPDVRGKAGFFGRYHADKGFTLYHEAAALLPQMQFHAWGTGPIKPAAPVISHGFTSDIAAAMSQVAVVVVPNLRTYFDLVVLEALSLGKPVVVTDTGGFRELPETPGLLRVAPDAVAVAAGVVRALARFPHGICEDNRRLYEERFSLAAFAQRHLDLAARLLSDSD